MPKRSGRSARRPTSTRTTSAISATQRGPPSPAPPARRRVGFLSWIPKARQPASCAPLNTFWMRAPFRKMAPNHRPRHQDRCSSFRPLRVLWANYKVPAPLRQQAEGAHSRGYFTPSTCAPGLNACGVPLNANRTMPSFSCPWAISSLYPEITLRP